MIKVAIIVPLYNEAESVSYLSSKLTPALNDLTAQYKTEVIFIDDGSTDDTFDLLSKSFSHWPNVKILKHQRNQGLGSALKTGFEVSSGDLICTMDSDCSYDPEKIPELILFLLDNDLDIVTASPHHPNAEISTANKLRLFLSRSISFIYGKVLPYKIYCYTSIFRIYRKKVFKEIKIMSPRSLSVTEILVKAVMKGFRIGEVPLGLSKRSHGNSKAENGKIVLGHVKLVTKILFTRLVPLKVKSLFPARMSLFLN